jgi:hypothetical protein
VFENIDISVGGRVGIGMSAWGEKHPRLSSKEGVAGMEWLFLKFADLHDDRNFHAKGSRVLDDAARRVRHRLLVSFLTRR